MYRDWKILNIDIDVDYYKKYRNKLKTLLRNAEKQYHEEQMEKNKNNLSNVWSILNRILERKKRDRRPSSFKSGGIKITDDKCIADHFNRFFVNHPKQLSESFSTVNDDPCMYVQNNDKSIFMSPVTEEEVLDIISQLKNKTTAGYDKITPSIVRHVKDKIVKPLVHICNLSLTEGIFPDKLKIAKVTPIYKKGDKSSFSNYRPVSVLPTF